MDNLKVSEGVSSKTLIGSIVPEVGTILPYAGSSAPTGWLLCNGGSFSSTEYPQLYALLGLSTTLPDLRSKYLKGASNIANTKQSSGNVGHTHNASYSASNSSNNNSADASHTHNMNYNGASTNAANHNHYMVLTGAAAYGYMTNAGNYVAGNQGNMVGTHYHYAAYGTNQNFNTDHNHGISSQNNGNSVNPSHSHVFSASSASASIGSNTAETILPPTIYLNYIVKAG